MKTKTFVTSFALILFVQPSLANIDLLRAALILHEPDVMHLGDDQELTLTKTYHSRSLHRGLWGFGWCSILEWKLSHSKSEGLTLKQCDHKEIPLQKEPTAKTTDNDTAWMEVIDGRYHVTTAEHRLWFDSDGRLLSFQSIKSAPVFMEYGEDSLKALVVYGQRLKLHRSGPFVSSIGDGPELPKYTYQGHRLMSVQQGDKSSRYTYSKNDNMTYYSSPLNGVGEIAYLEDKDQIHEWKRSSGCEFRVNYEENESEFKFDYEDRCPNRSVSQSLSLKRPSDSLATIH